MSSSSLQTSSDPGRAHWIFWELGLLATLAAIIATPAESSFRAIMGVIGLLFLMGLANQDSDGLEPASEPGLSPPDPPPTNQ
jgi:hypothetical protein